MMNMGRVEEFVVGGSLAPQMNNQAVQENSALRKEDIGTTNSENDIWKPVRDEFARVRKVAEGWESEKVKKKNIETTASEMRGLSPYEQLRENNIKERDAMFTALKLDFSEYKTVTVIKIR